MKKIINLDEFANGAVAERLNIELQKILENINDPNTDPKKPRKLTLTLTLKGDENRELANVSVQAKSALAPAKDVETIIVMDYDNQGKITGAELKSGIRGQTYMEEDGVYSDTGEKLVDFKQKSKELGGN